jgi:hypothetical protein
MNIKHRTTHMPQIFLQCKACGKIFPSGISIGPGSSATFIGNKSMCPHCGSWENIPDGTLKATVDGFIEILKNSENPLNDAKALLEALERSKISGDLKEIKESSKFSRFRKWIPDSPEKIAAYVAIVYTIVQLLTQKPDINIEYNAFVNQYNQTVNINFNAKMDSDPHSSDSKLSKSPKAPSN